MLSVRQSPVQPVSHLVVTWLLMVPLFFFACRGILWFQGTGGNTGAGAIGFNSTVEAKGSGTAAVLLTVFLCVILLLSTRVISILEMCRSNKVLVIVAFYALVSSLWSQDPRLTLQFGIFSVLDVLFAFYLYSRFTSDRLMRIFMLLGWIIISGSILFAVALPQYGVDHRVATAGSWQGVFIYKNTCSIMVTFLLSTALFLPVQGLRDKLIRAIYAVMAIFLVVMTQARTGWVVMASLLAFAASVKLIGSFRKNNRVAVVAVTVVATLLIASVGALYYREILLSMGKDPTLTGRTGIWKLVVNSAMKRPWLGYGYRAFWSGLRGESANISLMEQWTVPGAHNGFLEAWLDLGLVGLGLVLFTLFRASRDAIQCIRYDLKPAVLWYISILIMTVVTNLAEMTLMFPNYLTWIMYVLACVGLSQEAKRARVRALA